MTVTATSGLLRAVRAAALGLVCVALSVAGHLAAGGRAPSLAVLAILAVPVGCVAVRLTAARLGRGRLTLVLLAGQLGLHEAFMALAHTSGGPSGHGMAMRTAMPLVSTGASGAHVGAIPVTMLGAHVLAAVVCGLLLEYGERLAFGVGRWLVRGLGSGARAGFAGRARRNGVPVVRVAPAAAFALGGIGRRGPPGPRF